MDDNGRKFRYSCVRCKKEFFARIDYHFKYCENSIEHVDYILCKICGHKGATLYIHVKKHNLSIEEYEKKYGFGYCKNTLISISLRNSIIQGKSNYRNRLKKEKRFEELKEFNKKISNSVSLAILSNEDERNRRSKLLGSLNKTEKFRKKASETAIKTSQRKDIQTQRSIRLKQWREKNPEKFYEIIKAAHQFCSEPEGKLFDVVKNIKNYIFKKNQQINRPNVFRLNKSGIKQVDILDIKNKIIIEYDGEIHFKNIVKWNQLEKVQLKDKELNSLSDEFCIIRVGYDQFSYRKIDYGFKRDCLECLEFLIKQNNKGIYCLGFAYGKNNFLQTNWKTPNF